MRRLEDFSVLNWIPDFEREPGAQEKVKISPPTIQEIFPQSIPAYAKIFHRIHIKKKISKGKKHSVVENTEVDFGNSEENKIINEFLNEATFDYSAALPFLKGPTIHWREVCKSLGIELTPDLTIRTIAAKFRESINGWPENLIGPCEGSLDEGEFKSLILFFKKFSSTENCFCFYEEITTGFWEGDELSFGKFENLFKFAKTHSNSLSPTYWWAEDQTWLVYTDYDSTFSLVGGSEDLIKNMVKMNSFECLKLNLADRPFG